MAPAGGLAAINCKDGRRILELKAESGLGTIAAGLHSISCEGQKHSEAWRKLNYSSADAFELRQMRDNIRSIQSLGNTIHGFFLIGREHNTPDTYRRTLDFCEECGIVPFISTLMPTPGSRAYSQPAPFPC